MASFRSRIKLLTGMTVALVCARPRGPLAPCRRFTGIPPAHCPRAFALATGTDVGLSLAFLLTGETSSFLAFGPPKVASVATFALIFGTAGLLQRDRDRLATVLYFSAPSAATAFQFAMLEFVHDPASYSPLAR